MPKSPRSSRRPLVLLVCAAGIGVPLLVAGLKSGGFSVTTRVPTAVPVAYAEPAPPVASIADPELAAYVRAAKHAGEVAEPLLRCLAFPDWPGNDWPAGLAAAHCHYEYDPVPSLAEVATALDAADLTALEVRYADLLGRHFAPIDPSESLHVALARFDASADAAEVSARWLELAPTSPYALAARAEHLRASAHLAMGPLDAPIAPQDRANALAIAQQASALFAQALAIEPRLVPAEAGLADLALLIGDGVALEAAFARGEELDPGCLALARTHLASLGPRHGGSHEAMATFVRDLRASHSDRLLLALLDAPAAIERGETMVRFERFDEAQAELRPALVGTTDPEAFETAALAALRSPTPDHAEALGLLVAASRYRPGRAVVRDLRARLLMNAGERAWALALISEAPPEAAPPRVLAQSGNTPSESLQPLAR
jgi:tetratricopeptide (TPR) repeat protein